MYPIEGTVSLGNASYTVAVKLLENARYQALVDNIKTVELKIDNEGQWFDVQQGITPLSRAIGCLVEDRKN